MHENSVLYRFYENRIIEYFDDYERHGKARNLTDYSGLRTANKRPGYLSKSAQKSIETKLTPWLTCIKIYNHLHPDLRPRLRRRPIFVTLTLSQKTDLTHQEIKRQLLQQFIKTIRYNEPVKEFFWKAELQKNGNLHFHLVFDHYIDKKTIQHTWNSLQRKKGLTQEYERKYHKTEPPSTHVKSIQDMDRAISYVMKYVSKNENKEPIQGNIYRFSKGLTELTPFTFDNTIDHTSDFLPALKKIVADTYQENFFSVLRLKKDATLNVLPATVKRKYLGYYNEMYSRLYEC